MKGYDLTIYLDAELYNTFKQYDIECDVKGFRPANPAPYCNDPSSTLYGDPGTEAVWDGTEYFIIVKKEKTERISIGDKLDDIFFDEIIEKCEEIIRDIKDSAYQDYLDAQEDEIKESANNIKIIETKVKIKSTWEID